MPSAAAQIRILASDPPLPSAAATALATAIARLLAQFIREGRCAAASARCETAGCFVVIAWDGPALSGCSHDKLAQVIARHAAEAGVRILDAPPIAIGLPPRLTDRTGVRELLATGLADQTTPVWPRWAATLGDWQAGPVALADSPFARLLA